MAANRRARPGRQPDRSSHMEPSRKYIVVGHRAVAGAATGELVDRPLTPAQAEALLAAGHIALAPERTTTKPDRKDPEEAGHVAIAENTSTEG